jgi:GT2 family glycosyltransferase
MTYCRIFICHYADNAMTNQCVASLLPQCAAVGAEIIVIDDGSPTKYATEYPVKILRFEQNLHLVPAFSKAMQMLPATIYGMLNNDLICHPDMLATVLAQFDDPDAGIVAPGSSDRGTGVLYVPCAGKWGNVEAAHIDNHCFWTSQDVIDEIGWPNADGNEHRLNYYWNRYYCYLARKAGYKVIAARDAYVDHLGGGYNAEADAAGLAWITARLGSEVETAL